MLSGALAVAPAPHHPSGPDPNAVVRQVLAGSGYHAGATTSVKPEPTLLNRIIDWIGDRLGGAWNSFFRALRGAKDASAAFGIALIIAVLSLLVLVVVRVVTFFAGGSAPRPGAASGVNVQPRTTAAQWVARAREAAARGEYGAAIAALFNAALRHLDKAGRVPYDPARTPAEYRRLVSRDAAQNAPGFDAIARRFIVASFSRSVAQREDYEAALDAYAAFAAVPE